MTGHDLWQRYCNYLCATPELKLTLDVSRMTFDEGFLTRMDPKMRDAYAAMKELEAGAIANTDPDEMRMVGHYWLRDPELIQKKEPEIAADIRKTIARIKAFAADVHAGRVKPPKAERFTQVLSIGIGGSALGPMFVHDALGDADDKPDDKPDDKAGDKMAVHFIDNTDPDGFARILRRLEGKLGETLCLVISKSGKTPESRNAMTAVAAAYQKAGLKFAKHAVAVTGTGDDSDLDKLAKDERWLDRFPMWEWVGGRTSETGPVGLLPAALQGLNVDDLLRGAALCDRVTRVPDTRKNPAALLALMWYYATDDKGIRDMVVLPYKDRLLLFSRYLQQLVMESLGKGEDQGISVYGNKGSTDQHAYVQQLRDGVNNFFVVFIRVLEDGGDPGEPGVTAGDYLHGFWFGTRKALYDKRRQSVTITVPRVDARTVGALIALFERAVGFYASLVGINAYNQPGVQAGKKAADDVLALQDQVIAALSAEPRTAEQIASSLGKQDEVETVFAVLEHLAANGRAQDDDGTDPKARTFSR